MTIAGVLSPPAPEITNELARIALTAWSDPACRRAVETDSLGGLPAEAGPLRAWAAAIATPSGFPLLGTGLSAPAYAALLWNGARLDELSGGDGTDLDGPLLLAALAAADAATELDRVGRALAAADRVRHSVSALLGSGVAIARPTLSTLGAATAAALAGPRAGEGLARVLDLAASLMALAPGASAGAGSLSYTGHAAASGWLAAVLPDDAATPMAGSVAHTLSAVVGRAVPEKRPGATAVTETTVGALLEELR